MSHTVLQWLLVGLLVGASAIYVLWTLPTPRLRLRLLDLCDRVVGRNAATAALRRRALGRLAGGCSSCEANPAADQPAARRKPR